MRIPDYGDASANERPLDGPGAGVQNVGAGQEALAQGVERLGQGVGHLVGGIQQGQANLDAAAAAARQQAATIEATDAETKLEQAANRALYGTTAEGPQPVGNSQVAGNEAFEGTDKLLQKGLLNAEGLEAAKASGPTAQWIAERRNDLAENLTTPEAKQMFLQNTQKRVDAYHVDIEKHAAKSFAVAQQQTVQSRMAIGLDNVAKNYADPEQVASTMEAVENNIRALHKSDPPEVAQAIVDEFRKKADSTRLNMFVADKDWKGAQELYAQVKDQLGTDGPQMAHTIRTLREQQEGEEVGRGIVQKSAQPSGLYDTQGAVAEFRALPAAKQTKEAFDALNKNIAQTEKSNRDLVGSHFNDALGAFNQNHSLNDIDASTASWIKENDAKGWERLQNADYQWKQRRAAAAAGKKVDPTPAQKLAYSNVRIDMTDHPETYRDVTPADLVRTFADKVAPEHLDKLQSQLAEVHGKKVPTDRSLPSYISNEIVQQGRTAGVFDAKANPATQKGHAGEAFTAIEEALIKERQAYQAAHRGAEMPPEKVQEAVGKAFSTVTVDRPYWFNKDVKAIQYQTDPSYQGKKLAIPDEVPAADARRIRAAAQAQGVNITPEAIKARYTSELQKLQAKVAPDQPASAGKAAQSYDHPVLTKFLTSF